MSDRFFELIKELDAEARVMAAKTATPAQVVQDNRPKLTKRDVKRAREMHRNGCTQRDIADCLDVHPSTISRTIRGFYNK